MTRFLAAAIVVALGVNVATADIAPPPPPKGKKYVTVASEVKLGKDAKVSGYVFVLEQVQFRPAPDQTVTKLTLSPSKATPVNPGGRRSAATLYAVPVEVAKEFKADEAMHKALQKGEVKGALSLSFPGTATVSDTVNGDTVTWTYTVTGVGQKGILTSVSGDGADEQAEKKRQAALDQPGYLIGGIALALGLTFGGLWLLRRKK